DDRAVALVFLPSPIIDPHHGWPRLGGATTPSDKPEKAVVTHGDHQPLGKTRRWAPAQGQAEVMSHVVKSSGSPGPRCQNAAIKPLCEDAPATEDSVATEAPRHDDEPNRPACQWQIGCAP